MKTDKNFKMDKQSKRIISTIVNTADRGQYKALCIDAQVTREQSKSSRNSSKEKETV